MQMKPSTPPPPEPPQAMADIKLAKEGISKVPPLKPATVFEIKYTASDIEPQRQPSVSGQGVLEDSGRMRHSLSSASSSSASPPNPPLARADSEQASLLPPPERRRRARLSPGPVTGMWSEHPLAYASLDEEEGGVEALPEPPSRSCALPPIARTASKDLPAASICDPLHGSDSDSEDVRGAPPPKDVRLAPARGPRRGNRRPMDMRSSPGGVSWTEQFLTDDEPVQDTHFGHSRKEAQEAAAAPRDAERIRKDASHMPAVPGSPAADYGDVYPSRPKQPLHGNFVGSALPPPSPSRRRDSQGSDCSDMAPYTPTTSFSSGTPQTSNWIAAPPQRVASSSSTFGHKAKPPKPSAGRSLDILMQIVHDSQGPVPEPRPASSITAPRATVVPAHRQQTVSADGFTSSKRANSFSYDGSASAAVPGMGDAAVASLTDRQSQYLGRSKSSKS